MDSVCGKAGLMGLIWAWVVLTGIALMVWVSRLAQLRSAGRVLPPLSPEMYRGDGDDLPILSMLVAGKDEEANIEGCLSSLLRQDYPELQLIAVNDRSGDRTGAIMDRLAAEDSRLQAVHVRELKDGWFGKNNAMREGLLRAKADWLCFTDADCEFACPRTLRIAMRHALETGVDFLSILPGHAAHGFWERVIQPACSGIMMIWFNPLKVNNPRRKAAYANGAFMLMRRSCYEAIGGHEVVRTEVNEDMHMARLAKEAGQRLRVVSNEGLYTVRMYETFGAMWKGWSRIFYGCFGSVRRLGLSMFLVVVSGLLPWAAMATGAGATALSEAGEPGRTAWGALAVVGGLACFAQSLVMLRFYALNHGRGAYGLLYPLAAVIGVGILWAAMRRVGGRTVVQWRGTVYRGDRVQGGAA